MNAYKLANYLDYEFEDVFPHHQETIDMLRQQALSIEMLKKAFVCNKTTIKKQADRIAELEKSYFAASKDCLDAADRIAELEKGCVACYDAGKLIGKQQAENEYYTHPVKQLSDEEIKKIITHLRFIKQLLTCHGDLGGATEIDKEIRGNIEIVMINDAWIKALKEIIK